MAWCKHQKERDRTELDTDKVFQHRYHHNTNDNALCHNPPDTPLGSVHKKTSGSWCGGSANRLL